MPKNIIKIEYDVDGLLEEGFVEIPERELEPWGPSYKAKVMGQPLVRVDGYDRVTGKAKYTYDITLPGMLFGRVLRCPSAHARIKKIDVSKAAALAGVHAVISSHEATGQEAAVFRKELNYAGEMVAVVAAEQDEIAEDAVNLIDVEYEDLSFVVDHESGARDGAPKVRDKPTRGRTRVYPNRRSHPRGDVEKGLAEADVQVDMAFRTQVAIHASLEVHGSVARWDGDRLTVWESTQGVFRIRKQLSQFFQIPETDVRVIMNFMGGGFGSKLGLRNHTRACALLARKTKRPVKLMLDRRGDFVSTGNRSDSLQKIRGGAKKDGTLTALHLVAQGAVGIGGGFGPGRLLRQLYRCPNVRTEETAIRIHAGPWAPFRAPGHPEGSFALEQVMDVLAEKVGMDPLEFRRKNFADRDQERNQPYTSNHLLEAYEKGSKAIGWQRRRVQPGSDPGPRKRGLGMAAQLWHSGGGAPTRATVRILDGGKVEVFTGTQDIGTGTKTAVSMVVAEELGLEIHEVQTTLADTGVCPPGPSSGGSLTIPSVLPAVRAAAADAKGNLFAMAKEELGDVEAKSVTIQGKEAVLQPSGKKVAISILSNKAGGPIEGAGSRGPNPKGYSINSHGAQFAEVEVDTETGLVKVIKIVAAHEAGRVVNQAMFENQVEGGVIQGLGFALLEERVMDRETGRMVNPNMHDYRLPTISEIPEIEVIAINRPDALANNVGAKGLGEPPIIPTAGAIANAVYNAIGVRIAEIPFTPERVLGALEKERKEEDR